MPVTPLRDTDPTRVGRHRLLGRLGQGGMGTVFLGVSPDDRAVAVKVLRDGLSDPDARRRFRHELEALRRVRGPHLVEVLDADVDADMPFLVTRFVPGTRLDDLVNRSGPLLVEALLPLARGLADALTVLHAEGVVHRDLTPANVLVLDGEPHVIDLGLAVAADVTALTRSGLVIGTPGYLAPEQVTGSVFTDAVDVHAWGATIAFAATGRPPYGTGRPEAVLYRIVHGEPDLAGIPCELLGLVTEAMNPDARQRPSARDLLARLGGAAQAETVIVPLPLPLDADADADATTALTTTALRTRELSPVRMDVPVKPLLGVIPWDDEVTAVIAPPPPGASLPPHGGTAYEEPDYAENGYDEGVLAPLPARAQPARAVQVALTALAALAVVAAGTLVAPVVGALCVLLLLVVLRTVGRGSERLRDRRDRRGERRRDPVVATLGTPWHLLVAVGDTLTALPMMLLTAAVPAIAVYLSDPVVSGLERNELTAAAATVAVLGVGLARRVHRHSRLLLRRTMLTLTPGAASAVSLVLGLIVIAALLLATAEGRAPIWWPLTVLAPSLVPASPVS